MEDFMTLNTSPILLTGLSIEAMTGRIYTRAMFKRFQDEFKLSFECLHKKLSTNANYITYTVGLAKDDVFKWSTVKYNESDAIQVTCECSKFETEGYVCMHIIHILLKKSASYT
ncbi:hypothetical protein KSP39_PZI002466 [Platanthera zijinensis]|uniref:Protein FAR1-RELATED SEQUENCE n=1 Tax=Platanthera zijinensis TaxID=2320716 RepID=A0AAP0BYT1_9ASPA